MNICIRQIVVGMATAMFVAAVQAQVLAPQDMKPGAAAVATASTLPGERPLGVTPEPRTLPASPAPQGQVNRPLNPGALQQVEMQAQAAANQIPVRPRKTLPAPPPVIEVQSGQNKAFGIALSHVNRIITPFRDPEIKTTSVATISAERGVIYVSTLLQDEIALMVYEKGDPFNAISITMVPDAISPVSVKVNVAGYVANTDTGHSVANGDLARGWESDQPFVEVVKSTFREIALGRVPEGYGFQAIKRVPAQMPTCDIPGVEIAPQQLITGNAMVVIVSRITNRNYKPISVDESKCESPAVIGAATWPSQKLGPGQSAELYVAVRQHVETEGHQRPSLLGTGVSN
ncbi:type-F conjugative transfer system secretin TraK [Xanthomonas hortorum pv. vitians]|uniref:TraK domain-containing protein n=1 Tax=Xanthomonas hortorum TaxID=56454 RepID=UPI0025A14338|nr:type-F conjugative transfer system secretin TraK [Xanthomonas hortorum]WJM76705.1 type-F conjugative transfer system secretin TraK [Xanthomonas hortorum pv. vitians]